MTGLNTNIDLNAYPECQPLMELASSFIKAGKTPTLETVGVPFSVRSKQPFKNYRLKIFELFGKPEYAVGICLHEAAHAILMEEAGVLNCRFFGPAIQYDRANRTLFPSGARIEPGKERDRKVDEALIFERTTQLAVGGVALQKYAGITEVSDDQDYKDFARKYATMPDALRKEEPNVLWKRAQLNASTWLDKPETKQKILARAQGYLQLLYP